MEDIYCDISFSEKIRIISANYLLCMKYMNGLVEDPRHVFTKMFFSKLISSAHVLEDVLDFNGAKNNKNWYFYRELSAAIRHLSCAANAQKHISIRLSYYSLGDTGNFQVHGYEAFLFLTSCMINLAPVILSEAERLGIPIPEGNYYTGDFPGITAGKMLDYDILDDFNQEQREQQKRKIVKLAGEFLNVARYFDKFAFYEPHSLEQIFEIVPEQINEAEIRKYQMHVHNLQSYFDTYIIHGGHATEKNKLKQFRSFFSVVFHLLKMMGRLLHFYERHLHDAGYNKIKQTVQERLSEFINPEQLLKHTINYGLYYVYYFLSSGKSLVKEILNENIEHAVIRVGVPVTRGFHSRPSLLVAKIVQYYGGHVDLCLGEEKFDAGSVLDIQYAGGKIQHENIQTVEFRGDARALRDIEILAGTNYGEDSVGKGVPLPNELKYLRP